MKRRALFTWLAGAVSLKGENMAQTQTFHITGGHGWDDRINKPIAVVATDRLDAITQAGFTVWDEKSWKGIEPLLPLKFVNGQCPVCGWQAEAYHTGQVYCDGGDCWPPMARRIDCERCGNTYRQKAAEGK